MDIFEIVEADNVFSLHLNKKVCTEQRAGYQRIVNILGQNSHLTEVERGHLEQAMDGLRQLKGFEQSIDDCLRKFLT